jgi:amino acid permease
MVFLRKIFGVFLLIFSVILTLAYISSLFKTIDDIPTKTGHERSESILAVVIFTLIITWLIYFIVKKGIRLLKRKPQNAINEIGQS